MELKEAIEACDKNVLYKKQLRVPSTLCLIKQVL